jgi:hypothetical protein
MTAWRTKAYIFFGFTPGEYSFPRGNVEQFAGLVEIARTPMGSHLLLILHLSCPCFVMRRLKHCSVIVCRPIFWIPNGLC